MALVAMVKGPRRRIKLSGDYRLNTDNAPYGFREGHGKRWSGDDISRNVTVTGMVSPATMLAAFFVTAGKPESTDRRYSNLQVPH